MGFSNIAGALMYLVPIYFAVYLLKKERKDINCKSIDSDWCDCDGEGAFWYKAIPKENDSADILLGKIYKAARSEERMIKWRRSFVLATAIVYCIFFVVSLSQCPLEDLPLCLPTWQVIYMSVILTFTLIYFTYDYYSFHVLSKPRKHIRESIRILREKMKSIIE